MALTALLFAHHGAELDGEPPTVQHVAGVSVIERQIVQARSAGAARVLVAIERMPPGLAAILDRAGVEVVRAVQGFAVDPGDRVLVLQDSLVVDPRIVVAVLEKGAPALAVWKGRAGHDGAQRIDPATHWAGVSLYEGAFVAGVLDGLGEWDLQATLLRAAFTEGRPARVDVAALATYEPELRREVPLLWRPVYSADDASGAGAAMLARSRRAAFGWPQRFVTGAAAERLASLALRRHIRPSHLEMVATVVMLAAIAGLAAGWLWPGLVLALLAAPIRQVGATLATARDASTPQGLRDVATSLLFVAGVCGALAGHFVASEGWIGPLALVALIFFASAGAVAAAATYRALSGRHLDDAGAFERRFSRLAATPDTLPLCMLPFGIIGAWYAGFVWLALYSTLTCGVVQARFLVRLVELARANSPLMTANLAAARTQFLSRRGRSSN